MKRRFARILAYNNTTSRLALPAVITGALLTSTGLGVNATDNLPPARIDVAKEFDLHLQKDKPFIADREGHLHQTTIDPELQLKLQAFISERGSPISAVVVSDVMTGKILALVQGRSPDQWGGTTHTTLHNRFPAASLFKTVVTAAALEMTGTTVDQNFGLQGGCGGQDILPKGEWMNDDRGSRMTLRRAFGHSCNSFFAKLAINQLGLGGITHYARLFGWDQLIPTDFTLEPSKMMAPPAANSTTHTVGRFAAGFGHVSISPVHANWLAATIANQGHAKPLTLFTDTPPETNSNENEDDPVLMSADTSARLMDVMRSTVDDGTASNIFWRGRYRSVAQETGGKTGTLNGRSPTGLTTLFIGLYPLSRPQIAVSSVVVLEDHYHFKASQLGAEAILNWRDLQDQRNGVIRSASADERILKPLKHRNRRRR